MWQRLSPGTTCQIPSLLEDYHGVSIMLLEEAQGCFFQTAPPSSLQGHDVAYFGARCHRSDFLPPLCCPPVVLTSSICITWGLVRSRISGPIQPCETGI